MTLRKKFAFAAGGILILYPAVLGLIRILSGHDDPIVVDNPRMRIDFSATSHSMKVKSGSDGRAEQLSRDITTLEKVEIHFRDGKTEYNVDMNKEIALKDTNGEELKISTKKGNPYNQFVIDLPNRQFGECLFDSFFNHRCFAKETDRRLRTVHYWDREGHQKHLCLHAGEDMSPGDANCPAPTNEDPAGITFYMEGDPHFLTTLLKGVLNFGRGH